jgi:Skp family chaperone for outer membrane proteins
MERYSNKLAAFCVGVSIACVCGCGHSGSSTQGGDQSPSGSPAAGKFGGVAVVDMDEVAKQLGSDVALMNEINAGQSSLNQQLRSVQADLQDKLRKKQQELDTRAVSDLSKAELKKQQLSEYEKELGLQLNRARDSAQIELNAYRQKLLLSFREEVVPVAKDVAAERGLGVVITKNDTVLLAYDDAHDITSAVVAKLRANRSAAENAASASAANRSASPAAPRR